MSEIPFLKNKKNQGGSTPTMEVTRDSDAYNPNELSDSVCDELFSALEKKDKQMFKDALRALMGMINDESQGE